VGFAWSPGFLNGKTSIRAGAGLYHDLITSEYFVTAGALVTPFYQVAVLNSSEIFQNTGERVIFPDAYLKQPHLLLSNFGGAPQTDGLEWKMSQPATYKFSFTVQQQLLSTATLEVGYSGSRSTHNMRPNVHLNHTPFDFIPALGGQYIFPEQPLPNPAFNRMRWRVSDGSGWYNALLVTLTKRFSHGLQFQSSYTWSKSLDDSTKFGNSGDYSGDREILGQQHEWARSGYDIAHSWSSNFVYELPGRALPGLTSKVLGGWNISGVVRASSGTLLTPSASVPAVNRRADGTLTGNNGTSACGALVGCVRSTAQLLGGSTVNLAGDLKTDPGNRDQYFDPSVFAWPANFANTPALRNYPGAGRDGAAGALIGVGNAGRNLMEGPGIFNFDLTLRKDTAIPLLGEAGKMEFRFELFNAMNRVRMSNPGTSIFDAQGRLGGSAGVSTSASNNPRQIQLALRLEF
jgi:hypothetical protein